MRELFFTLVGLNGLLFILYLCLRQKTLLSSAYLHDAVLLSLFLYAAGSAVVSLTDTQLADYTLSFATQLTFFSYASACVVVAVMRPRGTRSNFFGSAYYYGGIPRSQLTILYLTAVVAAAACLSFVYVLVSQGEIRAMLLSVASGSETYAEVRKAITAGTIVYFAPGFVKELRDMVLLPICITLILFVRRPNKVLLSTFILSGFAASLVSGQRSVIMLFIIGIGAAGVIRTKKANRLPPVRIVLVSAAVFTGYLLMSELLGRLQPQTGSTSLLSQGAENLFSRLLVAAPSQNLASYPYWRDLVPTYGGSWVRDLSALLPGSQTGFANELHLYLGGSAQGNSPLGMPADIYLAWGLVGCIAFPPLYVFALRIVDQRLRKAGSRLGVGVRIVAIISSFSWYSPYLFLLNGGLMLLALFIFESLKQAVLFSQHVGRPLAFHGHNEFTDPLTQRWGPPATPR